MHRADAADTCQRITPGLHSRLIAEAERNGRSLNAEVVARLEARQAGAEMADAVPLRAVLVAALGQAAWALEGCEDRMGLGSSGCPDAFTRAAVVAFLRAAGYDSLADASDDAAVELA